MSETRRRHARGAMRYIPCAALLVLLLTDLLRRQGPGDRSNRTVATAAERQPRLPIGAAAAPEVQGPSSMPGPGAPARAPAPPPDSGQVYDGGLLLLLLMMNAVAAPSSVLAARRRPSLVPENDAMREGLDERIQSVR